MLLGGGWYGAGVTNALGTLNIRVLLGVLAAFVGEDALRGQRVLPGLGEASVAQGVLRELELGLELSFASQRAA